MAEQEDDNRIDDRILLDPDALGSGSGGGSSSGDSSANNQGTHESLNEPTVDTPWEPIDDGPIIPIDDPEFPDEPDDPDDPGEPTDPDEPAEPGTGIKKQKITVTGIEDGVSWQAIPNQTWLKVTEIVSGTTEDSFYVSVDANSAGESRTGIVTVIPSDNGANGTVNVYQQGAVLYTLSISPTTMTHDSFPGPSTLTITSNTSWTVSGPSWVSFSQTSGTGNAEIDVMFSTNTDTNSRSGTVRVSGPLGSSLQARCAVTQYAGEALQDTVRFTVINNLSSTLYVSFVDSIEYSLNLSDWPSFELSGYGGQETTMWNGMDNFLVVRALGVPGEMTYIGQGQKVYVFACHSLQDGWSYKGSCLFAGGNVAFPITEGITEL